MSMFLLIQKLLLCASRRRSKVSLSGKGNFYILELSPYVFCTSSKIISILEKSNNISKLCIYRSRASHRSKSEALIGDWQIRKTDYSFGMYSDDFLKQIF